MKDHRIVELERKFHRMNRKLRRMRRTAVLGLIGLGVGVLFLLFMPWMYLALALVMVVGGIFSLIALLACIGGGLVVKSLEFLYYKWLRWHFRRMDAQLRAEQIRMRHSGLSLKSLVG